MSGNNLLRGFNGDRENTIFRGFNGVTSEKSESSHVFLISMVIYFSASFWG